MTFILATDENFHGHKKFYHLKENLKSLKTKISKKSTGNTYSVTIKGKRTTVNQEIKQTKDPSKSMRTIHKNPISNNRLRLI